MNSEEFNQNTFGASFGSSSKEGNETNSNTQQNFNKNKKNSNKTKKSVNKAENRKDDVTESIIRKKITKKTRTLRKSQNPNKNTMKASVWSGDSFDNQGYDEEFIALKRRDKILKMIKNAHIEKLKNHIFLKEINNAHDEMIRLSQTGEIAEAKEMERELNTLHATVIKSNLDSFSKTKLARTHAQFGDNYFGSTFNGSKTNMNRRNLSKSERITNVENIYNSTIKKNIKRNNNENYYENNDEEEEEEEIEEEEIRKIKKKKNKNNQKNRETNQKMKNSLNRNNQQNIPINNNFRDNNFQAGGINQPNDYYNNPNNLYNINKPNNISPFQDIKKPYSNSGNIYNINRNISDNFPPQMNDGYNIYEQNHNQQIEYINDNTQQVNDNRIKTKNKPQKGKNMPTNQIKPKNYDNNQFNNYPQEYIIGDNKDNDNQEINEIPNKENNSEEKIEKVGNEPQIIKIEEVSINTVQNKVLNPHSDDQKNINPSKINDNNNPLQSPDQPVEIKLRMPLPLANEPKEKIPQKDNEPMTQVNPNLNPNINSNQDKLPYSTNPNQNPQLELPFKIPTMNENIPINNPNKSLYPNQNYPNNIPNQGEMPYYSFENPKRNNYYPFQRQKSPNKKSPNKKSPKKKSPKYNPNQEIQSKPKNYLAGPNYGPYDRMRRPQSAVGRQIYPNPKAERPYVSRYEYPRRYPNYERFGSSISRSKSRSPSKEDRKAKANILFAYPTRGECFACRVNCSISRSGNSPNKYVPYEGSFKKLRNHITYYDGEKYGYYQYAPKFTENN